MKQNKLFLLAFLFLSLAFFSCQEKNSNATDKIIQNPKQIDSLVFHIRINKDRVISLENEIVELDNIAQKADSLFSLYPKEIQQTVKLEINGYAGLDMGIVIDIREELKKSKVLRIDHQKQNEE